MLTGSSRTADSGRGEEMETDNNTNAIAIAPAEQPMDETREVLPNGTPGTSLDAEHSSEKIAEMGKQNADWLAKPVKMKKLFFGNTVTAKQLTFTVGNMGLIYRGNRCMRTAPFVCRTDQNDSNQAWAEFETHSFFGKGLSWWPWERASTKITYIPLKKTEDYMDTLNGDGFLMKFDEVSMSQLPMYVRYSKTKMAEIETDNRFIAQALPAQAEAAEAGEAEDELGVPRSDTRPIAHHSPDSRILPRVPERLAAADALARQPDQQPRKQPETAGI